MGSTLTGVPLYKLKGYIERSRSSLPLPNGEALEVVRMDKTIQPITGSSKLSARS
jgi:hypothetical protein